MAQPPDPYIEHVCELLASLGPVTAKRMFGGWGLSMDGLSLGIVAGDTLFLKTNADTEPRWLAAGGRPFLYEAKGRSVRLNFHTPPDEAMESPSLMAPWARLALQAALAARAAKPAAKRPEAAKKARGAPAKKRG